MVPMPGLANEWVQEFSDDVLDISHECSVASKAQGLLTGIRRIKCILRDGDARTDVPYNTQIFAEDGSCYSILISVEGRVRQVSTYPSRV